MTHGFGKFEVYKESQTALNNAQSWRGSTDLYLKVRLHMWTLGSIARPAMDIKWGITIRALLENLPSQSHKHWAGRNSSWRKPNSEFSYKGLESEAGAEKHRAHCHQREVLKPQPSGRSRSISRKRSRPGQLKQRLHQREIKGRSYWEERWTFTLVARQRSLDLITRKPGPTVCSLRNEIV